MAIELHHPELDRTITVRTETQAQIREKSGWVRVDAKPKPSDVKQDWVSYAEAQGMDRAKAESMTKEALIEEVG